MVKEIVITYLMELRFALVELMLTLMEFKAFMVIIMVIKYIKKKFGLP